MQGSARRGKFCDAKRRRMERMCASVREDDRTFPYYKHRRSVDKDPQTNIHTHHQMHTPTSSAAHASWVHWHVHTYTHTHG